MPNIEQKFVPDNSQSDRKICQRTNGLCAVTIPKIAQIRIGGGVVVAGLANPRKYLGVIAKQIGRPLVSLAAEEAVEIIEVHA
jgi:hypothetical protein